MASKKEPTRSNFTNGDDNTGFTEEEKDNIAMMWAPRLLQRLQELGQQAADSPDNQCKWSAKKLEEIQRLYKSPHFLERVYFYFDSRNRATARMMESTAQVSVRGVPPSVVHSSTEFASHSRSVAKSLMKEGKVRDHDTEDPVGPSPKGRRRPVSDTSKYQKHATSLENASARMKTAHQKPVDTSELLTVFVSPEVTQGNHPSALKSENAVFNIPHSPSQYKRALDQGSALSNNDHGLGDRREASSILDASYRSIDSSIGLRKHLSSDNQGPNAKSSIRNTAVESLCVRTDVVKLLSAPNGQSEQHATVKLEPYSPTRALAGTSSEPLSLLAVTQESVKPSYAQATNAQMKTQEGPGLGGTAIMDDEFSYLMENPMGYIEGAGEHFSRLLGSPSSWLREFQDESELSALDIQPLELLHQDSYAKGTSHTGSSQHSIRDPRPPDGNERDKLALHGSAGDWLQTRGARFATFQASSTHPTDENALASIRKRKRTDEEAEVLIGTSALRNGSESGYPSTAKRRRSSIKTIGSGEKGNINL